MNQNPALQIRRFVVDELKWETPEIFTLELVPEEGGEMISFQAGQWAYLHALNQDGSSASRVAMSFASSPEESKEKVEFGIKVYGDRTKYLSHLIPGDVIGVQGPFGVFTLHEGVSPVTIFAAGVGITPFRSMIRSLFVRQAETDVTLFFSNKTVEDTPYFEELRDMQKTWPHLTLIFTCTLDAPNKWEYEFGRFNDAMVERHISDFSQGEFLTCGPEGFMQAMQQMLAAHGVDTKTRFRRESFG